MLKKLQRQKKESKDDSFTRKLNEQIAGLQAELDTLDQEIELAKLPVCEIEKKREY